MAGGGGTPLEHGSLEITPTWAFALVCAAFILVSLILERGIHYLGKWVSKRPQKSLNEALDKVKEELMVVGFISLLLVVVQPYIAKICLPHSLVNHMLPCNATLLDVKPSPTISPSSAHRRLMFVEERARRILAAKPSTCSEKGKVPFVSQQGIHDLHIFLFVLAVGHVIYTCLTLILAKLQVNGWSAWEKKAQSVFQETPTANPDHLAFTRKHINSIWNRNPVLSWIVCLVKQFGSGVTSIEYQTLRGGFIYNHNLTPTFDFHKYILRVLENDFKKVVGISPALWVLVVVFLVLNIHGWYTYLWIGFLPLTLLLLVGAKLEHIVLTLALEMSEEKRQAGNAAIKLRDDLFWCKRPKLILLFLHFILFQNAFELAFFVWVWTSYGFDSCFRNKLSFVVARLAIGAIMLVLSSYRTLPLYALVSQMGDQFMLSDEIASTLTNLLDKAKKKVKS